MTQPETSSLGAQTTGQAQKTFRVAAVILAAALLIVVFYLFIAWQMGAWQMYTLAGVIGLFSVVNVFALVQIRRGRPETGSWLLILGMLVVFPAASFLVSSVGLIFGGALVLLVGIVASQTLPAKSARLIGLVALVVGFLTAGVDLLNLQYRLFVPQISTFVPGITGAIVLIIGFLIARQVWGGSLRNKLLVAFILITVISTGALSIFIIMQTTNSLHDSLERELSALTVNIANQIGDVFDQQINSLNTLAINNVVQQAVEAQNATYQGDAAAVQAEIDAKDTQWRQADTANNNADPLVSEKLNNAVSEDLRKYQKIFPDNVEVFVTDVFGGLVGSSARTSDYNQADEAWWQAAYNQGQGAIYLSDPQFDISTGKIGLQFALPVRSPRSGQVVGILRATYILTPLTSILQAGTGETGRADIFLKSDPANHIHEGVYGPSDPDLLKQIQAVSGQGLVEMNFEGNQSVVSQARVRSLAGNAAVENLGWTVVFHQHREEAFATLNQQIQGVLIVISIVLVLAIAAAVLLAQFLISPLTQLTETARQIAAGNLNSQARVISTDEIGVLASTFNSMTARLREFIDTLEQRVAARTQSLELAAQVGRAVSEVRALDVMLRDAAEIIRASFNLYYVQVYLIDFAGANLVLQAGTGTVGAELISRGHRLPLSIGSLNGRAAVEKRSVVIADTTASLSFRPNALLPETRSEMAIPLLLGEKVVGVLDLQSREVGGLNPELLTAFEALASQFAIAIQNANLLAEAEQARAEVEEQARRLVRTSWSEHLDAIHEPEKTGFVFEHNQVLPISGQEFAQPAPEGALIVPIAITGEPLGSLTVELETPATDERAAQLVRLVARQAAQQLENLRLINSAERYQAEAEQAARRLTREGWESYLQAQPDEKLGYLYDLNTVRPLSTADVSNPQEAVSLPLKVREEVVGKVSILGLDSEDHQALELAHAIVERLGLQIENLRQFDQAQLALAQTEKLAAASLRFSQAADLQEITQVAVETLGIPTINRAVLGVFSHNAANELEAMTVIANWSNGTGYPVSPLGTRYQTEALKVFSLVLSPEPVFFSDAFTDARIDQASMTVVKAQNLRAIAVLPLFLGARQLGVLMFEAEAPHPFSQAEIRLLTAMAPQIATVLENRRQFELAQRQAEREATLNAINQKIQGATTVEAVLQIAARELGQALGAPLTIAQLSLKEKK